jgi:hypothetical protein
LLTPTDPKTNKLMSLQYTPGLSYFIQWFFSIIKCCWWG